MISDEFAFIHQYFAHLNPSFNEEAKRMGLELGIGDDAALVHMDGTYAITTDTLIESVHFFTHLNPKILGARALEVNFSDLYAMGAKPQFVTLSLNIPERFLDYDEFWSSFAEGFEQCLERHHCALIGGNVSHSSKRPAPLSITVTAFGKSFTEGKNMRRSNAKVGDLVVITGSVCLNSLYVKTTYNNSIRNIDTDARRSFEQQAFAYDARIHDFVELLVQHCDCAIDVSDGLLGDLSHILVQSNCGSKIDYESLPIDPLAESLMEVFRISDKSMLKLAVGGGGDYNLLFCVSPKEYRALTRALKKHPDLKDFKLTPIGEITALPEEDSEDSAYFGDNELATDSGRISIVNHKGEPVPFRLGAGSYNHFIKRDNESEE